ncbi:HD-GYP domain-containing protein [Giesbergeria anulus]|uniref:HD-GYP domain, c-di-GMP phosphodiesterase class II (Or its inactivated variant) n=1 Tax=Giesbergeria anulus TaxID=180197 RepID=A0A1H9KAT1_9BURK|nr:HD domain-containing phosphohydrolase [Giesbergeria anulus]SEQ96182.1 HD-GYP domain, c-di-GMP phosphodiesterase class II (or its inactivated variant) [Giesbergeria anulus]
MHSDIVLGQPIGFSIYSEDGTLLFRRGSVIHMPDQISRLLVRGAQYNEAETIDPRPYASNEPPPEPVYEDPPPFDHLSGLLLNLKHVLGTTLKSPEQIDVTARIGKMAQAVQTICHKDVDSALAAPSVDTHVPYLVAHQMMGAVLTELIAQGKGLDATQRLPLLCAALTRDIGQIMLQPELDKHPGYLPDDVLTQMRQHPQRSAQLLEHAGVTDPVWLATVRSHHERPDGKGYPAGLRGEELSLGAKILAVSDRYSAMTKMRPYRAQAHFPQNALKEIYLKKDTEVDEEIARILISKVGLLSPGTLVRLKSGEIAVVKSPTVKSDAAIVYSVYGKTGMILTTPARRDTSQPGCEIVGLVPFSDCQTAVVSIRQVWAG